MAASARVPGIGAKTYEQAAGFLRIRDGENPLDCTAVHPESYPVVEQIARSLDTPVGELIANPQLLTKVDACQIDAGAFTVKDILEELRKPGRDPREQFVAPNFNEKVREFADVQPEMILEGVVTNVTSSAHSSTSASIRTALCSSANSLTASLRIPPKRSRPDRL